MARHEDLRAASRLVSTLSEDVRALRNTWRGATADGQTAFPDTARERSQHDLADDLDNLGRIIEALGAKLAAADQEHRTTGG